MQSNISKGKGHWGEVSFSSGVAQDTLNSPQ